MSKSSDALRTSLLAVTQTAVGCGIGLLIAGKLGRPAQKTTATTMISVGALLALPVLVLAVVRTVNRPESARGMRRLIRRRIEQPAFHPNASQEVLEFGPEVFALLRDRPGVQRLLALTNVTDTQVRVQIPVERLGGARLWRDVLSRARYQADEGVLSVALRPYGVAWLSMV